MRRSDREVKEFKDIVAIMEKCDVCRVALNNNGYPYIISLNFGMDIKEDKIEFYYKCGYKYRNNPPIFSEIDGSTIMYKEVTPQV